MLSRSPGFRTRNLFLFGQTVLTTPEASPRIKDSVVQQIYVLVHAVWHVIPSRRQNEKITHVHVRNPGDHNYLLLQITITLLLLLLQINGEKIHCVRIKSGPLN